MGLLIPDGHICQVDAGAMDGKTPEWNGRIIRLNRMTNAAAEFFFLLRPSAWAAQKKSCQLLKKADLVLKIAESS